jgi:hypothetical protein
MADGVFQTVIFKAADVLWRAVMNNVAQYIIMNGGKATVPDPISKRLEWKGDISHDDKQIIRNAGN